MKKKKFNWAEIIMTGLYIAGGILIGYLVGELMEDVTTAMIVFPLVFYVAFILEILLHEAGHLVGGLRSGYQFVSFRLFSWVLIRINGRMQVKKFSLPGTAGQCIMSPPDYNDGAMSYLAYNMGGFVANFLSAIVAWLLSMLVKNLVWKAVYGIFVIVAMILGLSNAIPMKSSTIANDGYNILELNKDKKAVFSLWLQLKIGAEIAMGKSVGELPSKWFENKDNHLSSNTLVASLDYDRHVYLLAQKRYKECEEIIQKVLSVEESSLNGIHLNALKMDGLVLMLLRNATEEELAKVDLVEIDKIIKLNPSPPNAIRTSYAIYSRICTDEKIKEKIKADFEKVAKNYPYPKDIEDERELMKQFD